MKSISYYKKFGDRFLTYPLVDNSSSLSAYAGCARVCKMGESHLRSALLGGRFLVYALSKIYELLFMIVFII